MGRLFLLFLLTLGLQAGELRVGIGRVKITPPVPIWLSGYAVRTHPAESVAQDLWAKALAFDDGAKGRFVLITTDLIGLPRELSDQVANRLVRQHGLRREQIAFNSSHTHSGPVVVPNLPVIFEFKPDEQAILDAYTKRLSDQLVDVVGQAMASRQPAKVSFGQGEAAFAINRRVPWVKKTYPDRPVTAPIDHSVPVLRISAPDGTLRAILFGYACHNTTLTGEFYQVSGDYAGYAQAALERNHPGATALFMELCGGDQNPDPRSRVELAPQHGESLAREVERILQEPGRPVQGPLRSAYLRTDLPFKAHTREQYETESASQNVYESRRAKLMLRQYTKGRPTRALSYPVQAVRWGNDLTLVLLGGEVVVDYALRLKKGWSAGPLVVAGYSNEVEGYIPSERVLQEGGYEGGDSMMYYGQPGAFAPGVEQRVIDAVGTVLKRIGLSSTQPAP